MIQIFTIGNGAANIIDKLRRERSYPNVSFYCNRTDKTSTFTHDESSEDKPTITLSYNNQFSTVIFVCCLGGNTVFPRTLDMVRSVAERNLRVVVLCTIPAQTEGICRRSKALDNFAALMPYCSVAVLLDNGKLPQSLFFSDADNAMCEILSILLSGSALSNNSAFADTATGQQICRKLVLRYRSSMPPFFEAGSFSFFSRATEHLCS